MKRISSFFLMLVFSALSLLAQDAIRYISYADGRVYAIPEKHISYQQEENGVVTLTLEGGNTFTYNVSEVEVSDYFASNLEATLTKYAFTNADNDQVYADVNATITEEKDKIVVNASVPVIGKRLRPSFELSEGVSLWLGGEKQKSGVSSHRFEEPIVFTLAPENHLMYTVESESNGFVPFGRECEVNVKYLTDHATGQYKIPTVYITFGEDTTKWDADQWVGMYTYDEEGNYIWTKEEWIENCTFQLDGAGVWPDIAKVEGCEVRGRGNSSWYQSYMSKNPFRIKFPKKKKQSPFNLTEDRQWVFIANKQNGSMTSNSIAQKVAAMVDAEALCHMIPVDVYINGHYRGSYCFTEKIGIDDNSVAIDEATGCLLELDDYFDETFKFRDNSYNLPVNVKDPDFSEEDDERVVTFEAIQNSFNSVTATLHAGGDISAKIDMESWAKFWLVNDLVRNVETHHPKSCYIFNEDPEGGEKWKFGPAWDFDWAFGYEDQYTYFIAGAEEDLFSRAAGQNKAGYRFYNALRNSEAGRKAYLNEWNDFMEDGRLQELLEYIDDYTEFTKLSFAHNNEADVKETDGSNYEQIAERSKEWLTRRANYIYTSMQSSDTPDSDEITTNIFIRNGIRYRIVSESDVEVMGVVYNYSSDEVVIPESVTFCNVVFSVVAICNGAFDGYSFSSITLPATLSSIGSRAFQNCNMLSEVISLSCNIGIGSDCFAYISQNAVLRVPIGTKSRYISNGWGLYFSNILEDGMPNEVITNKHIMIGTAQSSMTPNTWYFVHNSRIPNIDAVDFSEPGEEIKVAGGFVEDNGIGNTVMMSATSVIEAVKSDVGLIENNVNNCLIRFVPVDGKTDAYKVQFATGNWLHFNSVFTTTDIEENATIFNFYLIDDNERGRFGWNVYNMKDIVDNDGSGHKLSPWGSGKITGKTEGNNVWQLYDVTKRTEVTMVDGAVRNYTNDSEQDCDKLSYIRTLPNMLWNPLYVPFKIPVASISDKYDVAYINGMHSYDRNDDGTIDNLTMEVIKIANGTLKANYPYLIKAKSEADMEMTIEQEGTVLYPSESTTLSCSSVYTRFDITGTYNEMTAEELDGSLVITSNGSWEQMDPDYTLKPYRLYLTITNSGDSPVEIDQEAMSRISISVLGEETGVSSIEKGHVEKQVIYNLHGTRVQNPTKGGVYIVNGKKVVK